MAEDNVHLKKLQSDEICIQDTALGRHQVTCRRQLIASIGTMNQEEMERVEQEVLRHKAPADMVAGESGDEEASSEMMGASAKREGFRAARAH